MNDSSGPDTGSMVYYGMIDDILDEMERISDLRFQLSIVPDSKYGTFSNGTWSGLIGQLIDDVRCIIFSFTIVILTSIMSHNYGYLHHRNRVMYCAYIREDEVESVKQLRTQMS